jgi:DnaJ domain
MKDYYKILRLNNTANQEEIKKSFRKLAMVYHPDRSQNPDAHNIFAEINEAYEILSDSELKDQYDSLFNSQGDMFVETQEFETEFNRTRTKNRSARVYRATRKTKDIITPYIIKVYKSAAYASLLLMSLFVLDFVLPDIKTDEILKLKKFGYGNTLEYVLVTESNNVIVIEQNEFQKIKDNEAFKYEKSSIFGFDKYIYINRANEIETLALPGNFSKFFTLFIVIVFAFALLTIRAKEESEILQYGTANFYLSIIVIVSAFIAY